MTTEQRQITGTVREHDGAAVVRMEARYPTDIDDLWSAITEPDRLSRWVAEVPGDLREGGQFHRPFHQQLGRDGAGRGLPATAPAPDRDGRWGWGPDRDRGHVDRAG